MEEARALSAVISRASVDHMCALRTSTRLFLGFLKAGERARDRRKKRAHAHGFVWGKSCRVTADEYAIDLYYIRLFFRAICTNRRIKDLGLVF